MLAAREIGRCLECAFAHDILCRGGIGFINATVAQVLIKPPVAVTAPDKIAGARLRNQGIVNITQLGKFSD